MWLVDQATLMSTRIYYVALVGKALLSEQGAMTVHTVSANRISNSCSGMSNKGSKCLKKHRSTPRVEPSDYLNARKRDAAFVVSEGLEPHL